MSDTEKEKSRRISVIEGSFFSVMDGFGLRYINPYAVLLGAGSVIIGLLNTIPNLIGNLFQLLSIKAIEKHSRKNIVSLSIILQCLFWLPLITIGILSFFDILNGTIVPILVLIFYTLIVSTGSFGGPAWTSWMRDLVPEKSGDYFGKRNSIIGAVILASLIIAGIILEKYREIGKPIIGFSIIFSIALLGRAISFILLRKQYHPEYTHDKSMHFSLKDFIKKMNQNNFGRFALFTSFFGLAVAISSPYFSIYMLKDLGFEKAYLAFTIVTLVPLFSALISSKLWGKAIEKYGNIAILKTSGILISFIPIVWLFSFLMKDNIILTVTYLSFIEIFSGALWAGFNLASSVFIYEAVSKQRTAICFTYDNLTTSIGSIIGALIGMIIIKINLGLYPILLVFILSFIARLSTIIYFKDKIKEIRDVEKINLYVIQKIKRLINPMEILDSSNKRPGMASPN
jgi:MFS family permease